MMPPVIVCVVETGTPSHVAPNSVAAPPVSAHHPCIGVKCVIRDPMVRTIRHPPHIVPNAIAPWHDRTTHQGTWKPPGMCPPEYSRMAMMPIVFCASLPPCPSE